LEERDKEREEENKINERRNKTFEGKRTNKTETNEIPRLGGMWVDCRW
jgi:hypothetical protein